MCIVVGIGITILGIVAALQKMQLNLVLLASRQRTGNPITHQLILLTCLLVSSSKQSVIYLWQRLGITPNSWWRLIDIQNVPWLTYFGHVQ